MDKHHQQQPRPNHKSIDPFLLNYQPSELRIASEFFATWLPFLSRDLCHRCTKSLSDRIRSIDPESRNEDSDGSKSNNVQLHETSDNVDDNCDTHSLGSWKDEEDANTHSLGSWKDREDANSSFETTTPNPRMSWADMVQEDDEFGEEEEHESNNNINVVVADSNPLDTTEVVSEKPTLPREEREYIRFMNVRRTKDFRCFERVNGKFVNILEGLELHTGIFSAAEQRRIVNYVAELQEMGRKGQLKDRTYTAPQKWMRGKGRQTIQFGCCYNYAADKNGNPPGILKSEMVDPLPDLFKVIIRRLIRWHVLPPTCVPDSCIVNIYEEGDCIPPHIDNHDFVRPFCTVSFLSECNIVFGSNLKIIGPGEFDGLMAIPLPVGSVLVLNGNGADVAKHCVPAVPMKRISITFRRMDVSKRPIGYVPEPDLQGIQLYEVDKERKSSGPRPNRHMKRYNKDWRGGRVDATGSATRNDRFLEPREFTPSSQRNANRWSRNAAYLAEKQGLSVTDAIIDTLSKAGYDQPVSQKVMIQSTDSSVLLKFKEKTNYELVYKIDKEVGDVVDSTVKDIKGFADFVVVKKASVFPDNNKFLTVSTKIVSKFKSFNLSVYVETFSNEFLSQAWDFYSDATVEINTYVDEGGIDGVITDFPKTANRYRRNRCLGSNTPYMRSVEIGGLLNVITALPPAEAPLPPLTESDVTEPPLPPVSKIAPPSNLTPGTRPGNAQAKVTVCFSLSSLVVLATSLLL